ncbi:MAG: ABC transporter ATP-binding protein [Planctomycetes bacterium]|nr:ABC transporter ATP-binding protein [Planctomycetota bacterium]
MPAVAPTTTPTMKAEGITRSFGSGDTKIFALRDVSLELYPGQITLLMGPSGSGKSTLLAVLSGLLHPDTGSVTIQNQDLWAMTERQREAFRLQHFGFVFQGYNLFPALTARDQLEMILRWGNGASARDAREKTDEMLDILGLSKRAHLRPLQLSGGEKQRVAIGRALIKQPGFVFADEPTAALDWKHGQHVIELLRAAAHDQASTILVVAHDSRIIPFVDRVLLLEDGVLFEGPEKPGELFNANPVQTGY